MNEVELVERALKKINEGYDHLNEAERSIMSAVHLFNEAGRRDAAIRSNRMNRHITLAKNFTNRVTEVVATDAGEAA